jgi:tetratricopeptide (TPR) repeat protein
MTIISGRWLYAKNNPNQAIEHFHRALRHLPPSSGMDRYEDCLANAYLELARWDDAVDEYQRILRLNLHYPWRNTISRKRTSEKAKRMKRGKV